MIIPLYLEVRCDVQNNSVIETLKSDAICDQKNNIIQNIKNINYLRTAKPPSNLYFRDSAWATAHRPLVATFSA